MKTKNISEQIFDCCKSKELVPHSIVNNCVLYFSDGTRHIEGKSKKDLLKIVEKL